MKEVDFLEVVQIAQGRGLSVGEVRVAVEGLLEEEIAVEAKAELLAAMGRRGETVEEIVGFVEEMLVRAERPRLWGGSGVRMDVCGTGGDRAGMFNVSTGVMFVVAGCGVEVVKHGNRGVTSRSGGADVLEVLGVAVDVAPQRAGDFLAECGYVFLFAPRYHPAFRAVVPVRKLLAERGMVSIFNILGPLLNPARPEFQLAGIYRKDLLKTYAQVLSKIGRKSAWAIHGEAAEGTGLDEWAPCGDCFAAKAQGEKLDQLKISPCDFGISCCSIEELKGGSAEENAATLEQLLKGQLLGPKRDTLLLNSAAALCVCQKAANLSEGLILASESLDSGKAYEALQKGRELSKKLNDK